jgi:alpha-tubulin suppressor-like RCC1 family protein
VTDVTLKAKTSSSSSSGDGTGDDTPDPNEPIDSAATNRPNVLAVALGEDYSCARKPDGTVKCWGDDTQGQIGAGGADDAGVAALPTPVTGITDAVDLAAGRQHACVAHKSGKVSCWGYNLDGQLGNNDTGRSDTPVEVVGIGNAFGIAAGGNFSCAIRGTGSVACWGGNGSGQLATGDQNGRLSPVEVQSLSGVIQISAGQGHACAVKSSGAVVCWGDGTNGQLGNGNTNGSLAPAQVQALPATVQVAAGERSTCALTQTGAIFCWGANELGQLGTGAPNQDANPSPIAVAGVTDAIAIATGANHTCAVRKNGQVVCWGDGSAGQLGDGTFHDDGGAQANAVQVASLGAGNLIGAGSGHSCATTSTDSILCWGDGDRGQLGTGSTDSLPTPAQVAGYP